MALKMRPEHLEHIRAAITPFDLDKTRDDYRAGRFPRSEHVKDLNRRYRWDLLNTVVPSRWVCDNLYPYLNDEHIDSALKSIVEPL